ncbi:hypothetical protein ASPNIDRAFT_41078 [Aspergillus niger ATCC 1015]|nr:hypothetical protein ASPNIDRAFT_41078 [Aspergillus niger ATCC 1015]
MVSSSSTSMPSTRTITTPSPTDDDEDVEVVYTPSTSSTSSSSPSSIRLTAAGKCKAELKSGNIGLECPCNRGVFLLSHTNDFGDKCVECEHTMAHHKGAGSQRKGISFPIPSPPPLSLQPTPTSNLHQQ